MKISGPVRKMEEGLKGKAPIPSWLSSVLRSESDLSEEARERIGYKIIKSLTQSSEWRYWPPEVLKYVLAYDPNDSAKGYLME